MHNNFDAVFFTVWKISGTSAAEQSTFLKYAVKIFYSKSFSTFTKNRLVAVKNGLIFLVHFLQTSL